MDKINYKVVRKRLEFARERSKISLEEIGKKLGVHKSTISRWENGYTKKIQLPVFEALADIYDVNVMWLMGYDVPMEKAPNKNKDIRYASYKGYLDDNDLEPEDIEEIERFIEFIKNKRKKK